jgi:hypothetical protein
MRTLAVPTESAVDVFTTCISNVRDADLKRRLSSLKPAVQASEVEFRAAASTATYFRMGRTNGVGAVSTKEMTDVYKYRMAKKETPGRPIYDKIILSAKHGVCPLCGHRIVSTLDHHLPKAQFPSLSVTPLNLVPACSDCNKAKLDEAPTSKTRQTLHPYFDNVDGEQWLTAEVVRTSPAAVRFVVTAPSSWDLVMALRVKYHFKVLGLAKLYASNAATELENLRLDLDKLHSSGGPTAVLEFLQDRAASREHAHRNSWQTALYKALADSRWFCDGGFAS